MLKLLAAAIAGAYVARHLCEAERKRRARIAAIKNFLLARFN